MTLTEIERRHVEQFWARKSVADKQPRVDNSRLYAGSPMFYYCKSCGTLVAVLPETHVERPPQLCHGCRFLRDHALMPPPQLESPS